MNKSSGKGKKGNKDQNSKAKQQDTKQDKKQADKLVNDGKNS